jgi:hypothetical protein
MPHSMAPLRCLWSVLAIVTIPIAAVGQTPANVPPAAPSAEPANTSVSVARHTIIPVLIVKDVRVGGAGDAREAKTFKADVAQDIIVNGYIIAKKGDLAEGHFTTEKNVTKRVFSADVSQEVSLDIDDVVNFCGDTIHMDFERTFVGGVRGGFMSLGAHAHDAVFTKGAILKARSDRLEKSVCAEKTTLAPLPLPSDMIVPDDEVERK